MESFIHGFQWAVGFGFGLAAVWITLSVLTDVILAIDHKIYWYLRRRKARKEERKPKG